MNDVSENVRAVCLRDECSVSRYRNVLFQRAVKKKKKKFCCLYLYVTLFLPLCLQLSGGCELTVVLQDFTAGCSTEMSVSTGESSLFVSSTGFSLVLPVYGVCSFIVCLRFSL